MLTSKRFSNGQLEGKVLIPIAFTVSCMVFLHCPDNVSIILKLHSKKWIERKVIMPKTVGQDLRSYFPVETSEYTTVLTAILLTHTSIYI